MDDKVTLAQAAAAVHLHVNTVKNWRRAGELKTAQKVIERGIEVWYVDLAEVEQKTRQKKNKPAQSSSQQENIVDYSEPFQNTTNPQTAIVPQVEQFMSLVERSQQPLLDRLDKLTARNEELAMEVGQLRERLRALEANQGNQVTQAAPPPAGPAPAAEPPPDPTRRGFWRRLLGG